MIQESSDIVSRAQSRLGTLLRGKYRLDRVLGVGGMAVVYKATHRNQAEFAVKMLHPEVSLNADIRSRFLREGYAANSIKHPGAVLVVDDDLAEDGAAFLVMELLDGVSGDEAWERCGRRLPPDVAIAILIQLLDVLAAAHANEIVHRDIKPANLFLTRNGVVKVLDFGIARAREVLAGVASSGSTGTGMMLGTPAFMAPEQALGRSSEIDGRSDLWAAGAAFFSLVSGELVHNAESAQELMVKAATQPAKPLGVVAPHVMPSVAAIVDRAVAFRKEDRWVTASAMRDALMRECPSIAANPAAFVAALVPGSAPPPALATAQTMDSGRPLRLAVPERATPAPSGSVALTTSALTSGAGAAASAAARRRAVIWSVGLTSALVGIGAGAYALLRPGLAARARSAEDAGRGFVVATSSDSKGESADVPAPAVDGAPGAGGVSPPAACVPDATQCVGSKPEACSAQGEWVGLAVTAGKCGAECTPGTSPPQCNGVSPETCDPEGHWEGGHACTKSQVCRGGACVQAQVTPPAPRASAPPKPSCDPNYTLDENGRKHFKPECFR